MTYHHPALTISNIEGCQASVHLMPHHIGVAKELLGLMIHFNLSFAYLPPADSYVSALVAVISTIPVNMPPPGGNFGILCTLGRYIDATVNGCFEPPLHPATVKLFPMHAS